MGGGEGRERRGTREEREGQERRGREEEREGRKGEGIYHACKEALNLLCFTILGPGNQE